jgi:xylulose-5-phosphate/fructose-6-phosphate phosphoketolase
VFDNPDLLALAVVGDGEAETAPLEGSWKGISFLNPAHDGAVLPVLHLNGYKIANPAVMARIGRTELFELMHGHGYEPHFVSGDDPALVHQSLAGTMDKALEHIQRIQAAARAPNASTPPERPRWPMIILETPKGWTGPKEVDGLPVEGTWRAHQVPIARFTRPEHLQQLQAWLQSYQPQELFDEAGKFRAEFAALAPTGRRRMGANPHANGGQLLQPLVLPRLREHQDEVIALKNCYALRRLACALEAYPELLEECVALHQQAHSYLLPEDGEEEEQMVLSGIERAQRKLAERDAPSRSDTADRRPWWRFW